MSKKYHENLSIMSAVQEVSRMDCYKVSVKPVVPYYHKEPKLAFVYDKHRKPIVTEELKNIETMSSWKGRFPFNCYGSPKPILQTHPKHLQEACVLPELDMEALRKIRPIVQQLSPGECLNEMKNESDRRKLVKDIYTTTAMKSYGHCWDVYQPCHAIPSSEPAPYVTADPFALPEMITAACPAVSIEFKKDTFKWDRHQLRASIDSAEVFWKLPRKQRKL